MTAKWQYEQAYEAALVTARELRSENAKLREGYDSLAQEHVQAIVELSNAYREEDRLKAENAKLRELVRAFDWCTENFDIPSKCDQCPLPQSKKLEPECEVRMRELGVEVSDD